MKRLMRSCAILATMVAVAAHGESFVPAVQVQLSTNGTYSSLTAGMTLEAALVILDSAATTVINVGVSAGTLTTNLNVSTNTVRLDSTLTVDGEASGVSATMTVDANAVGFGATLYLAPDGHLEVADADVVGTMPCMALALQSGTGSKEVLLSGFVTDTSWAWTVGGMLYASTTEGEMTQTQPTGIGDQVQVLGIAVNANSIYFNPNYVLVELE